MTHFKLYNDAYLPHFENNVRKRIFWGLTKTVANLVCKTNVAQISSKFPRITQGEILCYFIEKIYWLAPSVQQL